MNKGKRNVLGVMINVIDFNSTVSILLKTAKEGIPLSVSAVAVHGVMTGTRDLTHRYRLNQIDLLLPDGQPVRWALNLLYRVRLRERVSGTDLMLKTCEVFAREKLSVFFYGSRDNVLRKLEENIKLRCPDLRIAGTKSSQFRSVDEQELNSIVSSIRASNPNIIFVGLGCPKQEIWIYENFKKFNCPIVAVGAAFDFHSGYLKRAPHWMQLCGLEWLFRLIMEPCRLWKRYLFLNPYFVGLLVLQLLSLRKIKPADSSPPMKNMNYA